MEHCKKNTVTVHSTKHIHSPLINKKTLKNPENMVNDFINLFTTLTEKWNLNQVKKEEAIPFLKDPFPWNINGHKTIPTNRDKTYINCLKSKNSSGHDKIQNEIVKTCTTQISHPLCYICNQSLYTFTKRFGYFLTDKTGKA